MKRSGRARTKHWRIETLRAMGKDLDHPYHGTVAGYNIGCACSKCRSKEVYDALNKMQRGRSEKAEDDAGDLADHGTEARYQYGCRCQDCTGAHREYTRRRRGYYG